jgi:hypothetical protein
VTLSDDAATVLTDRRSDLRNIALVFLVCAALGQAGPDWTEPPRQDLVKVDIAGPEQAQALERLGIVVNSVQPVYCIAEATPDQLRRLAGLGFKFAVLEENVSAKYYRNSLTKSTDGQYLTYAQFRDTMSIIAANNPTICKLETLGTSYNGNLLLLMKVSDNPQVNENEPEVFFDASVHGDEKIGWAVAFEFLKYLVRNYGSDPEVTYLVNNREIWVMPMTNPDGYVSNSRYNGHNVDCNRNWGWMFGEEFAPGAAPYSEPEIAAALQFFRRHPVATAVSFHAGTEMLSYPWSFTTYDSAPEAAHLRWLSQGYSTRGNSYPYGQGSIVMYLINGSSKDYCYGALGEMAWSIEVHATKTPPASQIDTTFGRNRRAMLFLCRQAGHGVHGTVTDSVTGLPLRAQVWLAPLPVTPFAWQSYSDAQFGDFHRYAFPGTYNITVRCPGYDDKTVTNVVVPNSGDSSVTVNVALKPAPAAPLYANTFVACSCITVLSANRTYPTRALGIHDGNAYQVDPSHWLVLDFDRMVRNLGGNDLTVYRASGIGVCTAYAALNWAGPWTRLGIASSAQSYFDLGSVGMDSARFVRFKAGPANAFMLDAVEAVPPNPYDVGCTRILAPVGTLDSGLVAPACSVFNFGAQAATYRVRMRIGAFYNDTALVLVHPSGLRRQVAFPAFSGWPRGGPYAVTCSTELSSDAAPGNDRQTGNVSVVVRDIACTRLLSPSGGLDSGAVVAPACSTYNPGSLSANYSVVMRIGTRCTLAAAVSNHAPLTARRVTFPDWTALERGSLTVSCSTGYADDHNPANDRRTGSVFIQVLDAGVTALLAPTGGLDSGTVVTPRARVCNFGNRDTSLDVRFAIDDGYSQTRRCVLPAGAESLLSFSAWTALVRGRHQVRCSAALAGDIVAANNQRLDSVFVALHDAGIEAILSPVGTLLPGPVLPQVRLHNYGTDRPGVVVLFSINSTPPYSRTITIGNGLPLAADTEVVFPSWTASPGNFVARCSLFMPTDQRPDNDTATTELQVKQPVSPGWTRKADLPTGPKSKNVKDGGCITDLEATDAAAFIYGLKGNGRCEFYQYSIAGNAWTAKESIPAVGSSGKKKAVKKGASITDADGVMFAAKGNGTLEWWKYDPALSGGPTYPWTEKTSVPTGAKAIKEGSGSAMVKVGDTTFIYFLKGSSTQEFYRYNVGTGVWESRASAPLGASGKYWKNGSGLTAEDDWETPIIYAVKGSYNEFYAYDVATNTWTTKAPLPMTGSSGKKKKVKDGAGLAFLNNTVYCLKGGGTREFWTYQADSDKWTQLEDMPSGGGKPVKGGGALTRANDKLYAFKGNNTLEFYSYAPASAVSREQIAGSSAQTGDAQRAPAFSLSVSPTLFRTGATIHYSLPRAGNYNLKLYDITGQLVTTLASGYHSAGSYKSTTPLLARGIYVLKLESGTTTTTAKLVIE